jgi:hypothetical protein
MKTVIEMAKENCPYRSEEMRGAYYDGFVRAAALVRAEAYKNWNPDVTFNEDGTFSLELPDGDEIRIIPPEREWVDLTCEEVTALIREGAADGGWQGFAIRLQTAFKEKNK